MDCRSVLDFSACHITGAVNLACSKMMRKRLQQNTVDILTFAGVCTLPLLCYHIHGDVAAGQDQGL